LTLNTEVVKDKSKAKRRKLERALQGAIKEKNVLPKDAFRVEHLNYKVSSLWDFSEKTQWSCRELAEGAQVAAGAETGSLLGVVHLSVLSELWRSCRSGMAPCSAFPSARFANLG